MFLKLNLILFQLLVLHLFLSIIFELNTPISEQEVLKSINGLKLNKACASDLILNEFLKFSKTKMLTAFTKLFNIVFTIGFIPDEWSEGIIFPIYKNKGDKSNLDNHMGNTYFKLFWKVIYGSIEH